MTSINPHYTFEYSQPDTYRFSHDSVFLARRIFELVRDEMRPDWRVLDLCAGCGIIGLDFLFHCHKELKMAPRVCDFLEIQSEYETHFHVNRERLRTNVPGLELHFFLQNYTHPLPETYDLILCNPPYFDANSGKLSPHEFKNRCRFFLDASYEDLIAALAAALAPRGQAFVLARQPKPLDSSPLEMVRVGDIRGTSLLRFTQRGASD